MQDKSMLHSAVTAGGKYEYSVMLADLEPSSLQLYSNKALLDSLCKSGCANYQKKWSCPPFAPSIDEFTFGWRHLYIMFMCINMVQFEHIRNTYLQIKAANSILKSRADKFLRIMAKKHGKYISNGSCRLCKPCRLKSDLPCSKPDLMTYSFEAMGINVAELVNGYFDKPLLWYKSQQLPEYTSVVSGLLTSERLSLNFLLSEYRKCVTS